MHRALAILLYLTSVLAFAQDTSPVQGTLDVLFAPNYEVVEQHIAAGVLHNFDDFPPEARKTWFGGLLMVGAKSGATNVQRVGTSGIVLKADLPGERTLEVELSNKAVTGDTATVDLGFHIKQGQQTIPNKNIPLHMVLNLHREEGAWKIVSLQETANIALDDTTVLVNLREAIISRNQATAVAALRYIDQAEVAYAGQHNGKFACTLETLRRDVPSTMNSVLFLPDGNIPGYALQFRGCNGKNYGTVAVPLKKGVDGRRTFCTDNSEVIYLSDGDAEACLEAKQPI